MRMKEGMLHFRLFSPLLRFFVLFCFVFVVVVVVVVVVPFFVFVNMGARGIRVPFTFPFCATSISVLERIRFKLYCTHF